MCFPLFYCTSCAVEMIVYKSGEIRLIPPLLLVEQEFYFWGNCSACPHSSAASSFVYVSVILVCWETNIVLLVSGGEDRELRSEVSKEGNF